VLTFLQTQVQVVPEEIQVLSKLTVHSNKQLLLLCPTGDKIYYVQCVCVGGEGGGGAPLLCRFHKQHWDLNVQGLKRKNSTMFSHSIKVFESSLNIQKAQYSASQDSGLLGYHLNERELHTMLGAQKISKDFQTNAFMTVFNGEYCDADVIPPLTSCLNLTSQLS
jgi:hypothetical protein